MRWHVPLLLPLLLLLSCWEGATQDENRPGRSTYLEGNPWRADDYGADELDGLCTFTGAIAVDDRTETAYVLQTTQAHDCGENEWASTAADTKTLYAVRHDRASARAVVDLSGYDDIRMLFPDDRILVMAETSRGDDLLLVEPETGRIERRRETTAGYYGTRLSPSRRYVVVADNHRSDAPIHVLDAATLETEVVPHGGDWLEAMWLNRSDRLFTAVFGDSWSDHPRARLQLWPIAEIRPGNVAGSWPEADIDVAIEDASFDMFFSYTWVGVAPDDATVVVPFSRRLPPEASDGHSRSRAELAVVDTESGVVRFVEGARGPVAFTPDGATIVAFQYDSDSAPTAAYAPSSLLFIDAQSLVAETVPLPIGDPEYYVTREGSFVVVASSLGWDQLVLFDYDTGDLTRLDGPTVQLREFVSRPAARELWLADHGLFRLGLDEAVLEHVELGWLPDRVNILPRADLLVTDDLRSANIRFVDPDSLATVRAVALPR